MTRQDESTSMSLMMSQKLMVWMEPNSAKCNRNQKQKVRESSSWQRQIRTHGMIRTLLYALYIEVLSRYFAHILQCLTAGSEYSRMTCRSNKPVTLGDPNRNPNYNYSMMEHSMMISSGSPLAAMFSFMWCWNRTFKNLRRLSSLGSINKGATLINFYRALVQSIAADELKRINTSKRIDVRQQLYPFIIDITTSRTDISNEFMSDENTRKESSPIHLLYQRHHGLFEDICSTDSGGASKTSHLRVRQKESSRRSILLSAQTIHSSKHTTMYRTYSLGFGQFTFQEHPSTTRNIREFEEITTGDDHTSPSSTLISDENSWPSSFFDVPVSSRSNCFS